MRCKSMDNIFEYIHLDGAQNVQKAIEIISIRDTNLTVYINVDRI